MMTYIIAQGIGAAVLWSLYAACCVWDRKAQTLTSYGFSVFTFCAAATFTALGALNLVTMAAP